MANAITIKPARSASNQDGRTARWQKITLVSLFIGYAGYYLCRSNLSLTTPQIIDEFSSVGIGKEQIGAVASLGTLFYMIGKLTNGMLTDFVGGRGLFLLGMVLSVVCTICFGLADGLLAFTIIWAVNRYCQSMGWGALMKITSRWYPVAIHATVMGVLSMSYLFGDALVRTYLGLLIHQDMGWRGIFFTAAGSLGLITVFCFFTLKSSPCDVGGTEPAGNPDNLFGPAGESPQPESLRKLLVPMLVNPTFWLVCLMNFGLTLIREAFTFWSPQYLVSVGFDVGNAPMLSMVFPLVGGVSALVGGTLSDFCGGKHGRVALPSMVLLCGALVLLGALPNTDDRVLALSLISAVSFFLIAPYSLCSGVMALDLGGKRGSSTAAGLIDGAGYLGAIFSGYGIAVMAKEYGWSGAFLFLAAVAGLTALATTLYWLQQEFRPRRDTPRS